MLNALFRLGYRCIYRAALVWWFIRRPRTSGAVVALWTAQPTRRSLAAGAVVAVAGELLRIWEEAKKTNVFVTHGITEAVFLGTRVIVLTAGPARMADNFRVELPHPRTLEMKTGDRFGEYTRRIYRLLGME